MSPFSFLVYWLGFIAHLSVAFPRREERKEAPDQKPVKSLGITSILKPFKCVCECAHVRAFVHNNSEIVDHHQGQ